MYEIDLLPVGNGEKSGDAIALRYTDGNVTYVHVVDGGTEESGTQLAEHIKGRYSATPKVTHLICTHIDDDHTRGLLEVLDNCEVGHIWINRPWEYAEQLLDRFDDDRLTVESLRRKLREAYPIVASIEDRASDRGIPITSTFQGQEIGAFVVCAPSKRRYLKLVPHFRRTPDPAETLFNFESAGRAIKEGARKALDWVKEDWERDNLRENVETSAENESSVVQVAEVDDTRILLTGDAGLGGLSEAADYLEAIEFPLPRSFGAVQIPHHGGRRNVAPSVLNRLFGRPVDPNSRTDWSAFFSASANDSDHPKQCVINAFRRRGARVVGTNGTKLWHHNSHAPARNCSAAKVYEYKEKSESWDDA